MSCTRHLVVQCRRQLYNENKKYLISCSCSFFRFHFVLVFSIFSYFAIVNGSKFYPLPEWICFRYRSLKSHCYHQSPERNGTAVFMMLVLAHIQEQSYHRDWLTWQKSSQSPTTLLVSTTALFCRGRSSVNSVNTQTQRHGTIETTHCIIDGCVIPHIWDRWSTR